VDFEFDSAKDAINRLKHDVSLAVAVDFELEVFVRDERFDYGEVRYIGYGMLGGLPYVLVFTTPGVGVIRAVSLRRSHLKEYRRRVESQDD
jgi:uncharacterized protein